ncbi:hypothetical protein E2562_019654 [Oryza meyeriana var. granulata]|uniref:DUF4220 domain-containing protein n=1 Tax=Oryza meyeriana var. granulata TaxID=110450 RepID=A0A6G1C7Z5_9ORYZ|nr:hypothetical protein E2562_019654 [Oryza meyeriana var. granulata]
MRALRDNQVCVCVSVCPQLSYPPAAQHSLVSHAQQLWNDWEIQCLVLVSFSLQVFLLFSAVFRRRHRSTTLSVLLWLAYLSADSVAVYLLGRLTLLVGDDPRHQLVLFWAPFLLLHLGGQETITAFSMEDCMLWKRHLLNLVIQMSLAIYVVGKQWKGGSWWWSLELIATVWVEMVCYIAKNCGASLHAKQLCAGGEFVTHVKMLLLILSFPF